MNSQNKQIAQGGGNGLVGGMRGLSLGSNGSEGPIYENLCSVKQQVAKVQGVQQQGGSGGQGQGQGGQQQGGTQQKGSGGQGSQQQGGPQQRVYGSVPPQQYREPVYSGSNGYQQQNQRVASPPIYENIESLVKGKGQVTQQVYPQQQCNVKSHQQTQQSRENVKSPVHQVYQQQVVTNPPPNPQTTTSSSGSVKSYTSVSRAVERNEQQQSLPVQQGMVGSKGRGGSSCSLSGGGGFIPKMVLKKTEVG